MVAAMLATVADKSRNRTEKYFMRNLDERPLKGRGRIIPIVIYLKEKGKPRKCFSGNGNPRTAVSRNGRRRARLAL